MYYIPHYNDTAILEICVLKCNLSSSETQNISSGGRWGYWGRCQSLNENTKWIFFIFRFISTTNTSFEFSIHSTQQSKHNFNVFLTFSLRYCPGCVRMPDLTSKAALYSSSNHKSVFLSHQRLLFPLTLQLKDVVKTEGMDPFSLVLVTEARDV